MNGEENWKQWHGSNLRKWDEWRGKWLKEVCLLPELSANLRKKLGSRQAMTLWISQEHLCWSYWCLSPLDGGNATLYYSWAVGDFFRKESTEIKLLPDFFFPIGSLLNTDNYCITINKHVTVTKLNVVSFEFSIPLQHIPVIAVKKYSYC